jgi:D-alanyl-D-alanine carboxypeptidase
MTSLRRKAALVLVTWFLSTVCGLPALANYASLIMDATTGRVLHEANADLSRYPASLTKMMTLYMLFEALEDGRMTLDRRLTMTVHSAMQPPTKLGLKPGQTITVENAILALVTKSANDIAAAVAESLAGSEAAFAWRMTARARDIGMWHTTFANASGLPDPGQVTTARDMGILALALVHDFPQYYHYFGTERFYYGGAVHPNHNRMLGSYYGLDGIKTGYTYASGFNLVASAQRDGRRVIGVVMGARSPGTRSLIMSNLLDQAFDGTEVITAYAVPETTATAAPILAQAYQPVEQTVRRGRRSQRLAAASANRRQRGEARQACRTRDRRSGCAIAVADRGTSRAQARLASAAAKKALAVRQPLKAGQRTKRGEVILASASGRAEAGRAAGRQQVKTTAAGKAAVRQERATPSSASGKARTSREAAKPLAGRAKPAVDSRSRAKATAPPARVRVADARRQPSS